MGDGSEIDDRWTTATSETYEESKRNTIEPGEYADAVHYHATQNASNTLYPGQIYEGFSNFLKAPQNFLTRDRSHVNLFYINSPDTEIYPLRNVTAAKLAGVIAEKVRETSAMLVIIKGYPSGCLVSTVGSKCLTDPHFFNTHLRFQCHRNLFSQPNLPSASENILKLNFVTIGSRELKSLHADQRQIDSLREDASHQMHQYHHELLLGSRLKHGSSVVRKFSVLDEKHFFLEQEISICLNHVGSSWILIALSDIGDDLSEGPKGPWLSMFGNAPLPSWTVLLPTVQHRSRIALNSVLVPSNVINQFRKMPQSIQLLLDDYGQYSDPRIMKLDAFYALQELFTLSAFAEIQCLNMLESKLQRETGYNALSQRQPTLSNLLYIQEILGEHIPRLKEMVDFIRQRGGRSWPRVSEQHGELHRKAVESAELLLRDYCHLLDRAGTIYDRCTDGVKIMMNNASLSESKRAIAQAESVGKLTLAAFFYIPLSFMTSFFGMNFRQFGTGELSIWTWFAASVPVFLASVSFLVLDYRKLWRHIKTLISGAGR